jgi:toxin ParE1/3/4
VPLEIEWSALAVARLREIRAYVAQDKPEAAERLAVRIIAVIETLKTHPYLGRVGAVPGTRELVIGNVPYIVVYRVRSTAISIGTIWHGAQRK